MDDPKVLAAWIAASVAIGGAIITTVSQAVFWFLDRRAERKKDELERRREALELALSVADHLFSNIGWNSQPAPNPHEWDISDAHNAMNGIIIYCSDPGRGINLFLDMMKPTNPEAQLQRESNPIEALHQFRCFCCDELGTTRPNYSDENFTWLASLSGAKYLGAGKPEAS